jgi:glycosyltransferase involved in cell wall biosynthesis
MKILHVDAGRSWRGGQRQAALLHEGLLERGYNSTLVCNDRSVMRDMKIPNTKPVAFGTEISPLTAHRLYKVIKETHADIVHSHEAHSLMPLLFLKKLGAKFHLVHTRRVDFPIKNLFKYSNPYVTIVAISQCSKDVLIKCGLPEDKVNVIYSGVPKLIPPDDDDILKTKKRFSLPIDATIFGTIANFSEHKDLPTMLEAFAEYLPSEPKSKLLMVGDGDDYDYLVDLSEEKGLSNNVVFAGFQENVALFLACMNVFLVSSKMEGLNTSIIDAMNMGLPIVSTSAGGIGELVTSGLNGILVTVGDHKALANAMKKVTLGSNLIHVLGVAAMSRGASFSDSKMVEEYINLYSRLL